MYLPFHARDPERVGRWVCEWDCSRQCQWRDDDQRWIDKLDQRSEADYFVPRALGKLCQLRARVVSVLGADCAMRVPDGGRSGYIAGVSDSPFLWGTDGARWVQPVEIKTKQQSIVRVHGNASNQRPSKTSNGQHEIGG